MGVCIKGMEMPTACIKCRFCSAFSCDASGEYIKDYYKRNDDCPLVDVKEPHGDLLTDAPTVIEAEDINDTQDADTPS